MRIAYLISQYPAPSHTFIRREIAALRRAGAEIHTFSVRPPRPEEVMSEIDRRDRDETSYILPAGFVRVLVNNVVMLSSHPLRYLSALRLSFSLNPPAEIETGISRLAQVIGEVR